MVLLVFSFLGGGIILGVGQFRGFGCGPGSRCRVYYRFGDEFVGADGSHSCVGSWMDPRKFCVLLGEEVPNVFESCNCLFSGCFARRACVGNCSTTKTRTKPTAKIKTINTTVTKQIDVAEAITKFARLAFVWNTDTKLYELEGTFWKSVNAWDTAIKINPTRWNADPLLPAIIRAHLLPTE